MAASSIIHDALIVGAGPAGLSSSLTLARALQTAVVFDSGIYRNQRATYMHTLPTWDHQKPADFRAAARAELLARYQTITFHDSAVTCISKAGNDNNGMFEVTSDDGLQWLGRTVILATGVRDVLPDIKGYDDCWVHGMYVFTPI
jgi:thioredoxin reductase